MKHALCLLGIVSILQGCAFSVHHVHLSGFDPYTPKTEGKLVTASAERFSVMGFSQDTSYIDRAVEDIQARCDGGDLVGVSTEVQTALGFFSWTDRVFVRGTCIARGDDDEKDNKSDGKPEELKPKRKKKTS